MSLEDGGTCARACVCCRLESAHTSSMRHRRTNAAWPSRSGGWGPAFRGKKTNFFCNLYDYYP